MREIRWRVAGGCFTIDAMTSPQSPSPVLVRTPEPPYWVVIFASRLSSDSAGYGAMAERMDALCRASEGFLGLDAARGPDGTGITVCYWRSEADIARWKADVEHREAQRLGHARFYDDFELRIARVERAYGKERQS